MKELVDMILYAAIRGVRVHIKTDSVYLYVKLEIPQINASKAVIYKKKYFLDQIDEHYMGEIIKGIVTVIKKESK